MSSQRVGGSAEGNRVSPQQHGNVDHCLPLHNLSLDQTLSETLSPPSSPYSIPPLNNKLVSKLKLNDGTPSLPAVVNSSSQVGILPRSSSVDTQAEQNADLFLSKNSFRPHG